MYSAVGRPVDPSRADAACSANPGLLLGAQRASALEQLDYDLLFRWFAGLTASSMQARQHFTLIEMQDNG
jgi:hypothetical protein